MSEPSPPAACTAANQRNRLKRILSARQRAPTPAELAELDIVLQRVNPERVPGAARSAYVGTNALTLTRDTLNTLRPTGYVFHKVNGIGALGAMWPVRAGMPADTMVFLRRNGVFAIDGVPLPLRRGRVLIDGELCLRRRRLSAVERARLRTRIDCIVGYEYLEPDDDNAANDDDYELCFAAHDMLVDDDARASSTRARLGDALYVQELAMRLARLSAVTQCAPFGDSDGENAIAATAAQFAAAGRQPAVTVFFKRPYRAVDIRLALCTLPDSLHGIPLDGLVFAPGPGPYRVGQTNAELLKYKAWRDNTADLVFVRGPDGVYRFFVVGARNRARVISECLWLGDTDDERAVTQAALDMEASRLAAGGDASAPLIFECEPSVADRAAFFALRDAHAGDKLALLAAAGQMLRWRPTGVLREEKTHPNSEPNFWSLVDALVNCVTVDDITRQIGAY